MYLFKNEKELINKIAENNRNFCLEFDEFGDNPKFNTINSLRRIKKYVNILGQIDIYSDIKLFKNYHPKDLEEISEKILDQIIEIHFSNN